MHGLDHGSQNRGIQAVGQATVLHHRSDLTRLTCVQLNPDEDSLQRMRALRGVTAQPASSVQHEEAAGAESAAAQPPEAAGEAAGRSAPAGISAASEPEDEEGEACWEIPVLPPRLVQVWNACGPDVAQGGTAHRAQLSGEGLRVRRLCAPRSWPGDGLDCVQRQQRSQRGIAALTAVGAANPCNFKHHAAQPSAPALQQAGPTAGAAMAVASPCEIACGVLFQWTAGRAEVASPTAGISARQWQTGSYRSCGNYHFSPCITSSGRWRAKDPVKVTFFPLEQAAGLTEAAVTEVADPTAGMSARQRQLWELQQRLRVSRKQNSDAVVAERRRAARPDNAQVCGQKQARFRL